MPIAAKLPPAARPSTADARLAQESGRKLSRLLNMRRGELRVRIKPLDAPAETVAVPVAALRLLTGALKEMAKGNAVAMLPVQAELSTQQAAEILNVSRPFLVQLLDTGKIPSRKVGTHRRVYGQDVLAFKERIDRQRLKTLDELAAQAQELDLDY